MRDKSPKVEGSHRRVPEDFLPVRPQWLALRNEPVLDPGLPIVDTHHHLMELLGHRYMLDEFLADARSGHRLVASVFVECRVSYRSSGPDHLKSLGETAFASRVVSRPERVCAGIVGNVDLRLGGRARDVLEMHVAAGNGRFRGIRNASAWHKDGLKATGANPPPGLLLDPIFRAGFATLAPLGLVFDAWLLHTQLEELIDLARAFPDTVIVCDHVGGPATFGPYAGKRDEVFAAWSRSMRELARCPNVRVKLGGLGTHVLGFDFPLRDEPPSSLELASAWRPYIELCLDAFGVDRAMFESNFPVDKGTCSWVVLWNAFKRLTSGFSPDERRALFSGTACKVYSLDLGGDGAAVSQE